MKIIDLKEHKLQIKNGTENGRDQFAFVLKTHSQSESEKEWEEKREGVSKEKDKSE
jgi:hypothetical protein